MESENCKLKNDLDKAKRDTDKLAEQVKANQKFFGNDSAQYDGLSQGEFIEAYV